MIFKHKKIARNITLVYGFRHQGRNDFSSIMTLQRKWDHTEIHGFITKKSLGLPEFYDMWKYLQKIVKTEYLVADVLPEHGAIYKKYLKCEKCVKHRTFNNLECERLTIRLDSKLKLFPSRI